MKYLTTGTPDEARLVVGLDGATHGRVVLCHAHPDDESFLTAGLIQRLVQGGFEVAVVYFAAGVPQEPPELRRHALARQAEAWAATAILGVREVRFLSPFDGDLSNGSSNLTAVEETLARASAVLTYDAEGGYGHADHRAVHRVVRRWSRANAAVPLVEATLGREAILDLLRAPHDVVDGPDVRLWSSTPGSPEDEIDFCLVLTDDEVKTKRVALMAHSSQLHETHFPATLDERGFKRWFGREWFARSGACTEQSRGV